MIITQKQIPGGIRNLKVITTDYEIQIYGTEEEEVIELPKGATYHFENHNAVLMQEQKSEEEITSAAINNRPVIRVWINSTRLQTVLATSKTGAIALQSLDNPDIIASIKIDSGSITVQESNLKKLIVEGKNLQLKERMTAVKDLTKIELTQGEIELKESTAKTLRIKSTKSKIGIKKCQVEKTKINANLGSIEVDQLYGGEASLVILTDGKIEIQDPTIDTLEARVTGGIIHMNASQYNRYKYIDLNAGGKIIGSLLPQEGNTSLPVEKKESESNPKRLVLKNQGGPIYLNKVVS